MFYRVLKAAAVFMAALAPVGASAGLVTERFQITMTDFRFESNFWAAFLPDRTTRGPSPLQTATLGFTVAYPQAVEEASRSSARVLSDSVSDVSFSAVTMDVPDVFAGSVTFDPTSPAVLISANYTGEVRPRPRDTLGLFINHTLSASGERWGRLSLELPHLFTGEAPLKLAHAEFSFAASLRNAGGGMFDSPVYTSTAAASGDWALSREIISVSSEPVPLPPIPVPGSVLGLSTGLLVLGGLARVRIVRAGSRQV